MQFLSTWMISGHSWLLIAAVFIVGVLHTLVPDHWLPITMLAGQRGWTSRETAGAALRAGIGHLITTLLIAAVVWVAGSLVAEKFGRVVDTLSSAALVCFGAWVAIEALVGLRAEAKHRLAHEHGHSHVHGAQNRAKGRTALTLILGSSPMLESIPAFFAAGKFGIGVILLMAAALALSTIGTYVLLCVYSTSGMRRIKLSGFNKYGEALSGGFIALVGALFWLFPIL
jgi:ABC-type nickel/cobalt efflux system permease component RcnA